MGFWLPAAVTIIGVDCIRDFRFWGFSPNDFDQNTPEIDEVDQGLYETPKNFGILSGDDLMLRLSVELPDVTHTIFAMSGAAGLMSTADEFGELIPLWDDTVAYSGHHAKDVDVTGGIFLKVERASTIAEHVEHVWLVDGGHPSRILEIVEKGQSVGTRFASTS